MDHAPGTADTAQGEGLDPRRAAALLDQATTQAQRAFADLDPLIHVPTRLRIMATLAALPPGDALTFTRLQDMLALTPGNLLIALRRLEEAGYLASEKTRNGSASKTTVALTDRGRAALAAYTEALRDLLGGLDLGPASPPAPSAGVALAGRHEARPSGSGALTLVLPVALTRPVTWRAGIVRPGAPHDWRRRGRRCPRCPMLPAFAVAASRSTAARRPVPDAARSRARRAV